MSVLIPPPIENPPPPDENPRQPRTRKDFQILPLSVIVPDPEVDVRPGKKVEPHRERPEPLTEGVLFLVEPVQAEEESRREGFRVDLGPDAQVEREIFPCVDVRIELGPQVEQAYPERDSVGDRNILQPQIDSCGGGMRLCDRR